MIVGRRSAAEGLRVWLLTFRLFRAKRNHWNNIQTISRIGIIKPGVPAWAQEHLKKASV